MKRGVIYLLFINYFQNPLLNLKKKAYINNIFLAFLFQTKQSSKKSQKILRNILWILLNIVQKFLIHLFFIYPVKKLLKYSAKYTRYENNVIVWSCLLQKDLQMWIGIFFLWDIYFYFKFKWIILKLKNSILQPEYV